MKQDYPVRTCLIPGNLSLLTLSRSLSIIQLTVTCSLFHHLCILVLSLSSSVTSASFTSPCNIITTLIQNFTSTLYHISFTMSKNNHEYNFTLLYTMETTEYPTFNYMNFRLSVLDSRSPKLLFTLNVIQYPNFSIMSTFFHGTTTVG